MKPVFVVGAFDRLLLGEMRLLYEAAAMGPVQVRLWSDEVIQSMTGEAPKFPLAERLYVLNAIRYVNEVVVCQQRNEANQPLVGDGEEPGVWVVAEPAASTDQEQWCQQRGWAYHVVSRQLLGSAASEAERPIDVTSSTRRVIVTGCYDWFHSGHVRFFEEVSQHGQLHAVVGHDDNIRLLKGEGHPMFPAVERRFIVGAVKYVHQAYISSGDGWLDAEPEIARIQPHVYAVNEDGDRPEKRDFCAQRGIEYLVLKRTPKEGLPRRQSTDLRGF